MKTALIVGGGLVALLVVWNLGQSSAPTLISTGTGTGTSIIPGSSGGGTGTSLSPRAHVLLSVLPGSSKSASSIVAGGLEAVVVGPTSLVFNSISNLL